MRGELIVQKECGTLGRIIKEARLAAGLTREELAERIQKSPRYLASLENERRQPSYNTLCTIIVALNIDSNKIFYPGLQTTDEEKARLVRMLDKCNDYELKIVSATVNAILDK